MTNSAFLSTVFAGITATSTTVLLAVVWKLYMDNNKVKRILIGNEDIHESKGLIKRVRELEQKMDELLDKH